MRDILASSINTVREQDKSKSKGIACSKVSIITKAGYMSSSKNTLDRLGKNLQLSPALGHLLETPA